MDYIYTRLNKEAINLEDLGKIERIDLRICMEPDVPIEGLIVGDYYLEVDIQGKHEPIYSSFQYISEYDRRLLNKIEQEVTNRQTEAVNNFTIEQDETTGIVTIKLFNINGELLDVKTLDLDTEHIIQNIALDMEHKQLVFYLYDGCIINCDISELLDYIDRQDRDLQYQLNHLIYRLNNSEIGLIPESELDNVFPPLDTPSSASSK